MPTSKYFDRCPPFPSDVPVVDLSLVSLRQLQNGSDEESSKLFKASQEHGFFILDLQGSPEGEVLLQDAEFMFDLTNDTMDLGRSELENYAYQPPKNLEGYKAVGVFKTEDGHKDVMEMFTIGQDDILEQVVPSRAKPPSIERSKQQCQAFFQHAHQVCSVIMGVLDRSLGLPTGTLQSLSPIGKSSKTSVRLLRAQPAALVGDQQVTLPGHTDIGTLTLLFNVLGGLQILPAGNSNEFINWKYAKPQKGCAVVNLGDTLVEWTGGLIRSSLHRVANPPGEQMKSIRQSVAYLMRPAQDCTMRRLRGSSVIPPVTGDEDEETRSVDDWAEWRAMEIIKGRLKPQTRGGVPLPIAAIEREALQSAA